MAAKYDSGAEYDVREWIKLLVGEDIGSGSVQVEKNLRNGQILCKSVTVDVFSSHRDRIQVSVSDG